MAFFYLVVIKGPGSPLYVKLLRVFKDAVVLGEGWTGILPFFRVSNFYIFRLAYGLD